MNDVAYYRGLLSQTPRIEAFRRAIHATVTPADVVLDIGAGLGTYALFAADAGARRVLAVDGHPVIHVAKAVAVTHPNADRVTWIRGWLPEVALPEAPTVVVFEDFPNRLLNQRTAALLTAVRAAVAPGARYIPQAATLHAAPLSAPALYAQTIDPLGTGDVAAGIDFSASRSYVANAPHGTQLTADALAAEPYELGRVRFDRPIDCATLGGRATWALPTARSIHGLAYWFDLELAPGIVLSNAPGAQAASWGQVFLPCDPPLKLAPGAELTAVITVEDAADGTPGYLSWRLEAAGTARGGHEFASAPAALGDLVAHSPDGVPSLTARGAFEARVLALVDGSRTVSEIAAAVAAQYPMFARDALLRRIGAVIGAHATASPSRVEETASHD